MIYNYCYAGVPQAESGRAKVFKYTIGEPKCEQGRKEERKKERKDDVCQIQVSDQSYVCFTTTLPVRSHGYLEEIDLIDILNIDVKHCSIY